MDDKFQMHSEFKSKYVFQYFQHFLCTPSFTDNTNK